MKLVCECLFINNSLGQQNSRKSSAACDINGCSSRVFRREGLIVCVSGLYCWTRCRKARPGLSNSDYYKRALREGLTWRWVFLNLNRNRSVAVPSCPVKVILGQSFVCFKNVLD